VALAIAIGYADLSETREKYLARLCSPFAERILGFMQDPECTTVRKDYLEFYFNIEGY